jgi:hypothetical protein
MITPTRIDPTAIYDDGALRNELGLTSAAITRARKGGHLRHTRQGGRTLYLGEWVLAWLRASAEPKEVSGVAR